MKKGFIGLISVLLGMMIQAPSVLAGTLVEFEGGIGVIPVQRVTANAATGTADRNDVRGVQPGGAPCDQGLQGQGEDERRHHSRRERPGPSRHK